MTTAQILQFVGLTKEKVAAMEKKDIAEENERKYKDIPSLSGEDKFDSLKGEHYTKISVGFDNGGASTRRGTWRNFRVSKKKEHSFSTRT